MRNPNGFGSYYKLKGNRRKPWIARTSCISEDKKQEFQTVGYYKTGEQALNALVMHKMSPVSPKANITLGELYEEWSATKYDRDYISKQTIDSYKAGWKHLSKHKTEKFKELRTGHLQSVINKCHKEGLSRSTLEKIKVVATMLYGYAMQNDVVNKNYAAFIKLPKSEKEEKKIFTDLDIQKLEKAPDQWAATILMLIYTGMRINELLGLTRFGVDMDRHILTGGLKTQAGKNRVIPINSKIIKHVAEWHSKNGEYLVCNEKGGSISDKMYREKFYYPVLERLKIQKLSPHACRHTFASLMRRAGADTKEIQVLLGHTKYSFTADTYTHTNIDDLKNAINKI